MRYINDVLLTYLLDRISGEHERRAFHRSACVAAGVFDLRKLKTLDRLTVQLYISWGSLKQFNKAKDDSSTIQYNAIQTVFLELRVHKQPIEGALHCQGSACTPQIIADHCRSQNPNPSPSPNPNRLSTVISQRCYDRSSTGNLRSCLGDLRYSGKTDCQFSLQ